MIVSHKFKFIFIKTRKTAGTSIEVFLSGVCGPRDVITPIEPHVDPHRARNYRGLWNLPRELLTDKGRGFRRELHDWARLKKFYNHASARTVSQRLPAYIWDQYYTFCVERNPWDKTLSFYHHIQKLRSNYLELDDFLRVGPHCIDYPAYTDVSGKLMVDRVLKYENLEAELSEVLDSLKVPFDGSLRERAKSSYRSDRRSYREVLNHDQRDRIAGLYEREIDLHGFKY